MTYYLVVTIGTLLAFATAILGRHHFFHLAKESVSLLNIILSDAEEDEKHALLVKQIPHPLIRLLYFSLIIVFSVAVFIGHVYCYALAAPVPFSSLDFESLNFYLAASLGSMLAFVPLFLSKPKSNYSELAQLLHQIILDNQNLSMTLFGLEKRIYASKIEQGPSKFLVVSGLARSGTTALTTQLFDVGNFHSLSYSNMPFLLAPNIWRKFYNPKSTKTRERAHGDSVKFGLDSVEALEEYFWKTQLKDSFIKITTLTEHECSTNVFTEYQRYQNLIRLNGKSSYLAKNNNMMLRYKSLRNLGGDFVVLLMYRNPMEHACSLLNQHIRFSKMQTEDPFVLEYMNWLGHHEFGLNQKQFCFSGSQISQLDKTSLDYWLEIWIDYYQSVQEFFSDKTLILLRYEDFLSNPSQTYAALEKVLHLQFETIELDQFAGKPKDSVPSYNQEIKNKAMQLYESMHSYSLKISE